MPSRDVLSLITICVDEEFMARLKRFVGSTTLVQVRAELQHYLVEEGDSVFIDRLNDMRPDICIIDLDRERDKALRTAERIHESLARTVLFATSSDSQPDLILRAMRSGCTEFLIKPVDRDQLLEALARVGGRRKEARGQISGQILALLGAKGGSGVTSLGIHLAALLAERHLRKTLLIDVHPDLGDVALYLTVSRHPYNFYDLAENTHRLDGDLLQGFLFHHPSGLDVLPAPEGMEPGRNASADAVKRVLEFLKHQYQFILVDCPPGLNQVNEAVIDQADQLYLVATAEVPALRNVARYADYLTRLNFPGDRIRVVINRHSKNDAITDAQIEKAVRRNIFWRVPNQYREIIKMINTGSPVSLAPRSEFMRSMAGWAEALAGKPLEAKKEKDKDKENKGFLGLWGR